MDAFKLFWFFEERRRATLGYLLAQCTLVRGDGHGARQAVRVRIRPVERRLVKRVKA